MPLRSTARSRACQRTFSTLPHTSLGSGAPSYSLPLSASDCSTKPDSRRELVTAMAFISMPTARTPMTKVVCSTTLRSWCGGGKPGQRT